MQIKRPDLEKFIADQVRDGRFHSAEEVVEAAFHCLMMAQATDRGDFDEETIATILRSNAQCDRGEGIDFRTALVELRRKYEQR